MHADTFQQSHIVSYNSLFAVNPTIIVIFTLLLVSSHFGPHVLNMELFALVHVTTAWQCQCLHGVLDYKIETLESVESDPSPTAWTACQLQTSKTQSPERSPSKQQMFSGGRLVIGQQEDSVKKHCPPSCVISCITEFMWTYSMCHTQGRGHSGPCPLSLNT